MKSSSKITIYSLLGLIVLISCEKEKKGLPMDADGNTYDTVVIGKQVWLTENLKTTKYINGDPIPLVTDNSAWSDINRGAYCWYENNIKNKDIYGALYNGYAARLTDFICPVGYHVPTKDDWSMLFSTLKDAPEEIKQSFKSKQVGWRRWDGTFLDYGGCWWTSSPSSNEGTITVSLDFVFGGKGNPSGHSIRCIKDP